MTDAISNIIVAGSEAYWTGYELGNELEARFGEVAAHDFASAISENASKTPDSVQDRGITAFACEQVGENDERPWVWRVSFDDGSSWRVEGWCDYTGWDCQSDVDWEIAAAGVGSGSREGNDANEGGGDVSVPGER